MNEQINGTGPEKPGKVIVDAASGAKICPACQRKLLTQTSILCNWCGAKIDDPDFLSRAAMERQARDEQERTQVEVVAQEEAQYGIFGRLKRRGKPQTGGGKSLI